MIREPFSFDRMDGMNHHQVADYLLSFEPDEVPADLLAAFFELYASATLPAQYKWKPRPDQPERYDQQTAFFECRSTGVIWLLGGNGAGTTETTMAKVAKFVLNTPAPRPDTPFWVIGGTYEQSMETCWKEKLYGHGHILDEDIDWDRVQWYRPKMQLPFRVPLLPTRCQADKELFESLIPPQFPHCPDGNWCLEFKAWSQGAHAMMARSIGGFAFVEQFPWGTFIEVNRGCREYSLPGSKLVEYTPVDPDLSGDIEEMITNGRKPEDTTGHRPGMKYLPHNWEVFHANTECALEAGHVTKEWFEEYFGMIPPESLGMRLKGLFASYEGVIYKTFDPAIHVIGDEIYDQIISSGASHRRAIDWGAGPQNAFVCLWGARNRQNQWFIYDELYSVDQEKTVVDHLVDITRRHPWPNEPWYGTTYADPSSPGNIRLAQQLAKYGPQNPKVPNLNMSMARNAVFEGIEHVRWLLKRSVPEWNEFTECMVTRPRLFIHYSCSNLIRELKKYRWVKGIDIGRSDNPTNPRPEPLKFDDHCCFAAGTLVSMSDGSHKRIEDIRVGDRVLSHLGVADVQAAGCTGIMETVRIQHETGTIDCTALHPFYHADTKDYRSVSVGDVTCRLQGWNADAVGRSRLLNGAVIAGDDIPSRAIIHYGTISDDQRELARKASYATSGFTRRCGKTQMVKSLMDSIFTTRTKTLGTTGLKTLSVSSNQSTSNFTQEISSRLAKNPKNGTPAMPGESGIQSMQLKPSQSEFQRSEPAKCADQNSKLSTEKRLPDSATSIARWQHEENERPITQSGHVQSAADYSWPTNTRRLLPVLTPVEVSKCLSVQKKSGLERVYNLTTSDGTVFVNGLLAKQCDALRYLTFSDDSTLGLTIDSIRSTSKAAMNVPKSNGSWRDIVSGNGDSSSNERFALASGKLKKVGGAT